MRYFIEWIMRWLRLDWQRGWTLQDYKNHGYNGDIKSSGGNLILYTGTHPEAQGYRVRKCEIARKVRRPKQFDFSFTITGFTTTNAWNIVQQFWSEPLAPTCYLTIERKHGNLLLHMQNKVVDNSDRGYHVATYHTFNINDDKRINVMMQFKSDSFRVACDGVDSGWHQTPFLNYNKCWIKAGAYWSDKDLDPFIITIHKAKIK